MRTWAATILLCVVCCASGQTADDSPGRAPPEDDRRAAESLRYRAENLGLFPNAPGREVRIRACLEFAHRLSPADPDVNKLLADTHRAQGDLQAQRDALKAYLAVRPADFAMARRWLIVEKNLMNTAEDRIRLYESVVAGQSPSAPLKAEALAEMAVTLAGQGRLAQAREALARALELDACNFSALEARWDMLSEPTDADEVEFLLPALGSDPADAATAIRIADKLQAHGLQAQAKGFFDHAMRVATADARLLAASGLADVLLDLGQADKALALLEPLRKDHPLNGELGFKMIEAYRAMGQADKADDLASDMMASYKNRAAAVMVSPALTRELAWFYLAMKSKPGLALNYARQANEAAWKEEPQTRRNIQMLLGAAELMSGNVKSGEDRLWQIAGGDIFAAAYLAEYWYANGKGDDASKTLLAGASLGRGGWAWRRLKALAEQNKVTIPPMKDAEAVRQKVEKFDLSLLAPAAAPQDFLDLRLEAVRDRVAPGEPVQVRSTLTNKGKVRIPLGARGLLVSEILLKVAGPDKTEFTDLPVATWPAPRYLMPGETLALTARVDVGRLARVLNDRPLEEFTLTVSVTLGPVAQGGEVASATPSVAVKPVTITRLGLMARLRPEKLKDMPAAYEESLGWIVFDMKRGPLPARMRAARQVASLLSWMRRIEIRDLQTPPELAGAISKPVLLRMLKEVLKDASPAVRAEAISALGDARLDAEILKCLSPAVDDSSALVRMSLVELVGASNTPGKETIVTHLVQDGDALVRQMASAFAKGDKPAG